MSQSSEISWLSEKQRLACFHLESEQPGLGGVRRRQPVVEDDREHSLNKTPLHSSTPIAGAGSKDWRKNFASSPESDCSNNNNNGDWSLGGDSGYGGLDSSRIGGSLPFPKKPSSWWRPLLRRVLGRPSFLEPEMAPRWLRLHPQQMIALVLTAALLACIGFSSVLLFRHMPIPRNPNPSRDVIDQEMMGEFYDDPFEGMQQIPFEGMEQIFGMQEGSENVRNEQIEEEIETEEGEKLEEVQDTVEQIMKANLEKKKVLLTKIKSFGLPTAPVDNLLGPANKTEDKTNLESPKKTDSLPDSKSEASVEAEGGQAIAKEPNGRIGFGGKKGAANASEGDIKQKSKRTKAVNPLVKKRRKKTSKAKKAKEL